MTLFVEAVLLVGICVAGGIVGFLVEFLAEPTIRADVPRHQGHPPT